MPCRIRYAAGAVSLAALVPLRCACAQQPTAAPIAVPPVVISATRLPTPADEVGSSVTVITADQIARKQQRFLPQLLRDVPGLFVEQSGGPGGQSSVFIRGANGNQTKMLIDGIDVSDPTTGVFDFAHLETFDIARIEVLRGPQSGLYGSDAIGGVINIITKAGSGPPRFTGLLEGGSLGTFNQAASASGSMAPFTYSFNAAHLRSTDIPVTPLDLLPPGRRRIDDRYDNVSLSSRLGGKMAENFDVGLVTRLIDTTLWFTGQDFSVFPSAPAAAQSQSDTRQLFTRGTAHLSLFGGAFEQTAGLAYTDYDRRDASPDTGFGKPPANFNRGGRIKGDWLGTLAFAAGQTLTLGAEHQLDEIRQSPITAQMTNDAGFVQLQSGLYDRFFNTVSLRYDSNDRFGGAFTYRFASSVLVPETGTRLKGSVGTGFKAPTLTQLFVSFPAFNFFANPNLKPERSFGYDAGFEQNLGSERARFGATWFSNDFSDLIAINPAGTSNANIASAHAYGIESFAAYDPLPGLRLRADYTYTLAMDSVLHQQLLRRPRHKASLTASWDVTEAASVSATVVYIGARTDGNRDFSIPRLEAGGYTVVNLAGSYDLGNGFAAFGRIDNLLDRTYQDPTGFLRPGLSVIGGIKMALYSDGAAADRGSRLARSDPAATPDGPRWASR
jgi:vitamin B12 transporter